MRVRAVCVICRTVLWQTIVRNMWMANYSSSSGLLFHCTCANHLTAMKFKIPCTSLTPDRALNILIYGLWFLCYHIRHNWHLKSLIFRLPVAIVWVTLILLLFRNRRTSSIRVISHVASLLSKFFLVLMSIRRNCLFTCTSVTETVHLHYFTLHHESHRSQTLSPGYLTIHSSASLRDLPIAYPAPQAQRVKANSWLQTNRLVTMRLVRLLYTPDLLKLISDANLSTTASWYDSVPDRSWRASVFSQFGQMYDDR